MTTDQLDAINLLNLADTYMRESKEVWVDWSWDSLVRALNVVSDGMAYPSESVSYLICRGAIARAQDMRSGSSQCDYELAVAVIKGVE